MLCVKSRRVGEVCTYPFKAKKRRRKGERGGSTNVTYIVVTVTRFDRVWNVLQYDPRPEVLE